MKDANNEQLKITSDVSTEVFLFRVLCQFRQIVQNETKTSMFSLGNRTPTSSMRGWDSNRKNLEYAYTIFATKMFGGRITDSPVAQ